VSSPAAPQPRFFVDRSLGRKAVPDALRADGWDLVTLAEYYGIPTDQEVADCLGFALMAARHHLRGQ
jgi:hypothetical protein